MDVLIVSRGLPTETYPLNGIFEFDQAKALVNRGVRVVFFAIDLRSIRRKRKLGIVSSTVDGVNCVSINIPVGAVPRKLFLKIGTWALNKLYKQVYKETKPDIVHAHFAEYGYMAAKLCERESLPLVITEHSSAMNNADVDAELLEYARFAYAKANAVIAVGTQLGENIKLKTGISCDIIPNVLNEEFFAPINSNNKKKDFGFVFTGRLIELKRPLLLIDAFNEVQKEYPDIRLGLIGEGELRGKIEDKITEYSLDGQVTLYGLMNRKEIIKIYEEYNCFVLPSSRETFGVACIEAMACGLPVIATKCGGPEDFVTPNTGLLIPVDDKRQLADAMIKMIIHRDEYDSASIRKYVYNTFSENSIADQLLTVYERIIE